MGTDEHVSVVEGQDGQHTEGKAEAWQGLYGLPVDAQ